MGAMKETSTDTYTRPRPVVFRTLPVLAFAALSACTHSVPVDTEFPEPLIAPMPVAVAVYYDESLSNFEHTESIEQGSDWKVKLGDANLKMFERLFESMFQNLVPVSSPEAGFAQGSRFEAIIIPAIEEMQIAPPRYGESEFFEAWIQYRVEAFHPDREPIVNWLVSGYGRSEGSMLQPSKSLQEATVLAMRDAAANIVIKFRQQPRIREWLDQQENANE